MIPVTWAARKNTIFLEERLGLTNWRQSYRLTGTHPSPRSVSVWRLTNSSGSSSSTSRLTLCTQLSLMGNTETRHWEVTNGGSWLVQKASSQIYRNREGFNLYPLTAYWEFKAAKARIGFITKNAITALMLIPELDLVQEDHMMTTTRVKSLQMKAVLIMGRSSLKPWGTSWCSDERQLYI